MLEEKTGPEIHQNSLVSIYLWLTNITITDVVCGYLSSKMKKQHEHNVEFSSY